MAVGTERGVSHELRELRSARGISQGEAARRSRLAKGTLSKWESGSFQPRGAGLARLLDALEAEPRLRARLLQAADPRFARAELASTALGAPVDVGSVVRAMRCRRESTQADLARVIGVTQATVARWESGEIMPSGETIHALGFALGASVEEMAALACAQGQESGRVPDSPSEFLPCALLPAAQSPLYVVASLGLEAELWGRAARDPQWDAGLCRTISERAVQLFVKGRLGEAQDTARRAMRFTAALEIRLAQTFAFSTLLEIAIHNEAAPLTLAGKIETWATRLPDGHLKGWMLWEQALRLAEGGRPNEAYTLHRRMADMTALDSRATAEVIERDRLSALFEIEIRARQTGRAEATLSRLIDDKRTRSWARPGLVVRFAHSKGEAADETVFEGFCQEPQFWDRDEWFFCEKHERIKREQSRLVGARS